jgi:excisionase family DNA binding protein
MTDAAFYSPADVSQALGVSTSTIKRWVDDGVLPAHKTAGGHRKLLRADVLRLVRDKNFPQLDLARLDLPAMHDTDTGTLSQRLLVGLHEGDMAVTRAVIHGAFAAGLPLEKLGDEVIAPAMHRLGRTPLLASRTAMPSGQFSTSLPVSNSNPYPHGFVK